MTSLYNEDKGGDSKVIAPNKKQTTLRIPKELDETLTNKAKELGISKNAYILMIITNFCDKPLFSKGATILKETITQKEAVNQ